MKSRNGVPGSKLMFFRQVRQDGGIRSGVEIDGRSVLSLFKPGSREPDPGLLWYVDVEVSGSRLPHDAGKVRSFLLEENGCIGGVLERLADRIPAGCDPGTWPVCESGKTSHKQTITVTGSAMRRLEARKFAGILKDLAKKWDDYVQDLPELSAA